MFLFCNLSCIGHPGFNSAYVNLWPSLVFSKTYFCGALCYCSWVLKASKTLESGSHTWKRVKIVLVWDECAIFLMDNAQCHHYIWWMRHHYSWNARFYEEKLSVLLHGYLCYLLELTLTDKTKQMRDEEANSAAVIQLVLCLFILVFAPQHLTCSPWNSTQLVSLNLNCYRRQSSNPSCLMSMKQNNSSSTTSWRA